MKETARYKRRNNTQNTKHSTREIENTYKKKTNIQRILHYVLNRISQKVTNSLPS